MSSTHQYHRLIAKATSTNPSTPSSVIPLARDLFRGFFEGQKDPNDLAFLSETAVKHSVFPDTESAMAFFNSGELKDEIETAYKRAQTYGITGVPFFVFEDKYAVSGALSPEEFTQVRLFVESAPKSMELIRLRSCKNSFGHLLHLHLPFDPVTASMENATPSKAVRSALDSSSTPSIILVTRMHAIVHVLNPTIDPHPVPDVFKFTRVPAPYFDILFQSPPR